MDSIGKYIFKGQLGMGTSGMVMMAQHADTGVYYAIKIVGLDCRKEAELAWKLKGIQLKYIVRFYDVLSDNKYLYIVMEFCNGLTLQKQIQFQNKPFDILTAVKIIIQVLQQKQKLLPSIKVAKGIQELNSYGLMHRDIKPANIVCNESSISMEKEYKLCDLGHSKQTSLAQTMEVGTPFYMAPELLSETPEKYDEKIDVWPLGMVFFEMLAGRNYYKDNDDHKNIKSKPEKWDSITKQRTQELMKVSGMNEELIQLLNQILKVSPKERPSITTIIEKLELINNNYASNQQMVNYQTSQIRNTINTKPIIQTIPNVKTKERKSIRIIPNQVQETQNNQYIQPSQQSAQNFSTGDSSQSQVEGQLSNQSNITYKSNEESQEPQNEEELMRQRQLLEEQLYQQNNNNANNQSQIKELEEKNEQLKTSIQEQSETENKLKNTISHLRQQLSEYQNVFQSAQQENEKLCLLKQQLKEDLRSKVLQLDAQNTVKSQHEQELKDINGQIQGFENQQQEISLSITNLQEDILPALMQELVTKQNETNNYKKKLDILNNNKEKIIEQNKDLQLANDQYQTDFQRELGQFESLSQKKKEIQDQSEKLKNIKEEMTSKQSELIMETSNAEEDYQNQKKQLKETEEQNRTLEENLQKISKQIRNIQTEISKLQYVVDDQSIKEKNALQKLDVEIKNLKRLASEESESNIMMMRIIFVTSMIENIKVNQISQAANDICQANLNQNIIDLAFGALKRKELISYQQLISQENIPGMEHQPALSHTDISSGQEDLTKNFDDEKKVSKKQ